MFAITPNTLSTFMNSISKYIVLLSLLLIGIAVFLIIFIENDYYQGISFKIMFIHVPAAWLSLAIFLVMGISSIIGLIFKSPTAFTIARSLSPIGLIMSIIVLVTGSIWGNLTWGAYWVWDARLTSMLILAFIYLGHILLLYSFEHFQKADFAASILAIIGMVNLPIVKFSVDWWSTLHQPASISIFTKTSIHHSMMVPLGLMTAAFALFSILIFLMKYNTELIKIKNKGLDRL